MARPDAAVIAAAGRSTRLRSASGGLPKPLVEIDGTSIATRALAAIQDAGIPRVVVVIGYGAARMRAALGDAAELELNPFFAQTNNMASLWFGLRAAGECELLYMHADVVFHPGIVERLISSRTGADIDLAVDVDHEVDQEAMKVEAIGGRVVASSKEIPFDRASGEWIGLARISAGAVPALRGQCEELLAQGDLEAYDTAAISALARNGMHIGVVETEALSWAEIDTPGDLRLARERFGA